MHSIAVMGRQALDMHKPYAALVSRMPQMIGTMRVSARMRRPLRWWLGGVDKSATC